MINLETLEGYFTESEEASRGARLKSEKCRDYYDGNQLTAQESAVLAKRKQPHVVFNRVQPKMDFLMGSERQQRTDPKAYPRTPKHEEAADSVTDAIRFVLDRNNFDIISSDVFENELIEGTGGVSVDAELKGDEIWVTLNRIRWDRLGIDPYSLDRDAADARYTYVVDWRDLEHAKEEWPEKADMMSSQMADANSTYDDKPQHWFDHKRQRVMLVDMYFIHKGKWHKAIFSKGVMLEGPELSPYVDEDGEPVNAHIVQSAKVKRDGQRYGPSELILDIQDEINKRRSKSLHILSTRQTFAKTGRIENINKFKREANKADGHLEFPVDGEFGKDFGFVPNDELVGAQLQMYQEAINQIDSVSANAALSGKTENDLSGRAVQSLQQGGMIELTPLFDGHSQWKKRVYRAVWDRIKQYWNEERWIRVTDNEENLKFVGLNVPITQGVQRIAEQFQMKPSEVMNQFPDEVAEIHRRDPQLAQVVDVENDIAEIDVDIILEEVPDVVNLQSEQFDLLVKMYQANPEGIDWEDVVSMSTLRNKDRILKKDLTPEEQQQAETAQAEKQEVLQLERQKAEAEIQGSQAEAEKDLSQADKAKTETQLMLTQALS